jgi:hypothetical protein
MRIKHSWRTDGLVEVWMTRSNGVATKVLTHTGPNRFNDLQMPFWKFGLYKWDWNNNTYWGTITKRIMFYDNVRIGDAGASLAKMSSYGGTTTTPPQLAKPAIPTGVVATAASSSVILDWADSASSQQVTRYQVYRSTRLNDAAYPYVLIADGPTASAYTDSGLTNGTTYYYRVSALNSVGYGDWTAPVAATPTATSSASECSGTGTIQLERWTGVYNENPDSLPFYRTPNATALRTMFEAPTNIGDWYGTRMRGYVCPPITGSYVFWIAGDDRTKLYLSTDATPNKMVLIASSMQHTGSREWTKYASQRSAPITLVAGKKYYIQARHHESGGADSVAVGWQLPNGALERPIPGSRLMPWIP